MLLVNVYFVRSKRRDPARLHSIMQHLTLPLPIFKECTRKSMINEIKSLNYECHVIAWNKE